MKGVLHNFVLSPALVALPSSFPAGTQAKRFSSPPRTRSTLVYRSLSVLTLLQPLVPRNMSDGRNEEVERARLAEQAER